MRRIMAIGLTTLTTLSTFYAFPTPARASFGDFLIGIGAAAGASAIINSSNRRDRENRYGPVSPKQEYYRGIQDGTNGRKYDNSRNSSDYDKGYETGLRRREAE